MATKGLVIRNGLQIGGPLSSGTGDDILTRDNSTKLVGSIPTIDTTAYLSTTLSNTYILVGNSSNIATARLMSGDVTINNLAQSSISAGVVTNTHISNSAAIAYSKLNLTEAILNTDINASANIARTKLASGTAYRLVTNNASGVMTDAAAITASRVLVSDVNGIPTASGTSTTSLSYLDASSSIQTQLNSKLTATLTTPATGDILYYSGGVYINKPIGTTGQVLTVAGGIPTWASGVSNGLPTGGTVNQYLAKVDGTDYNVSWNTLTLSKVTDVTATFAEVNKLAGATVSTTELNYVTGVTSSIQNQLDSKQSSTLPQNAIWVGNGSNLAATLAAGTNGYVLTVTAGVPSWQPASGGGTPAGANTYVQYNDGGAFGGEAAFAYDKTNDALTVGNARFHTTGTGNLFIGNTAGNFTLTGTTNTGAGNSALKDTTSGIGNAAFGYGALRVNTSGSSNSAFGSGSLNALVGAFDANSAFGASALNVVTGGSSNSAFGASALAAVTTGSNNIAIGANAGDNITTGSANLIIGYNIDAPAAGTSNQLSIQNIIFGTGNSGTGTTVSTGKIAVGTNTPDRRFHVEEDTATTNAVTYLARLTSTSSGTPANGIGVGLEFEVETSASNNEVGATIEAVTTDVTAASEDFDLVFKTMSGGATPATKLKIAGSGDLEIGDSNLTGARTLKVKSSSANAGLNFYSQGSGTFQFLDSNGTGANITIDPINSKIYTSTSNLTFDARVGLYTGGSTYAKAAGAINTNTSSVGNVGAGEDDLHTFNVPGSTLSTNKDTLEIEYSGTFAANANTKRIRVYFGATLIIDTGALAFNNAVWYVKVTVIRTGATTQKAFATFVSNSTVLSSYAGYSTPAETLSSSVLAKITGEATSNNDIVCEASKFKWVPSE